MSNFKTSAGVSLLVRIAVVGAVIGLCGILLFLWRGFTPWTVGVGLFFGAPLLVGAVVLYLIGVVRDLRQHDVL